MLSVGEKFPEFELQDQDGNTVSSKSLAGSKYVIYYYPKDDTPGCTTEACEFRDSIGRFKGIKVFGVSPDSVASHKKFADKFGLPFPLLADEGHRLAEACGAWGEKSLYGKKYMGVFRTTFVVGPDGKIEQVWQNVKPDGHAQQVLESLG